MGSNTLQAHQLVALAGRQGQGTEALGLPDVEAVLRLMSFMRRCRTATGSAWRTGGYRWYGAVRAAAHTSKLIWDV
eukprot:jgi/Tetstr1/432020/TSEL_021496.t1